MSGYFIKIALDQQRLSLFQNTRLVKDYLISTAANGAGNQMDSFKTPLGWHQICEKVGDGMALNTVFVGRKPTGEVFNRQLFSLSPDRDWILTRILRLEGLEPGINKGGNVDTYQRYIYIHGTHEETSLGQIGSRGCVRMANNDVIELFNTVPLGTKVYLEENQK